MNRDRRDFCRPVGALQGLRDFSDILGTMVDMTIGLIGDIDERVVSKVAVPLVGSD